jgi:hypothetical protein
MRRLHHEMEDEVAYQTKGPANPDVYRAVGKVSAAKRFGTAVDVAAAQRELTEAKAHELIQRANAMLSSLEPVDVAS